MSALHEPVEAIRWIHDQVKLRRPFPTAEAALTVRALQVALEESNGAVSLLPLDEPADYMIVHGVNVALLSMKLGEAFGIDRDDALALGLAGLLHDVGTLTIAPDVMTKPGQLTPQERALVKLHPAEGARLLIEADNDLDLAAVVAYEHHIRMDGGGYPSFRFPRSCHFASRLVQLCDVFDALRTRRPHKDAWPLDIVLSYLAERSGFEFDPEITRALAQLVQDLRRRSAIPESVGAAAS